MTHSKHPPAIMGDSLHRQGLQAGSMKERSSIAVDDQSSHITEKDKMRNEGAWNRTTGGFNRKARAFNSVNPTKLGAHEEDMIPMFGTQPPMASAYKT